MKRSTYKRSNVQNRQSEKRCSSPASHFHKIAITVHRAYLRVHAAALKTRAFIDTYGAFIELQDIEPEIFWPKLLPGEVQPGLRESQAQPLARQIWPHTQTNRNRMMLAIQMRLAAIPHLCR